jgi:hypothetical protein
VIVATTAVLAALHHQALTAGAGTGIGADFRVAVRGDRRRFRTGVRHADCLVALPGERCRTPILTLSVASIVITTIGIVMTAGDGTPTLASH